MRYSAAESLPQSDTTKTISAADISIAINIIYMILLIRRLTTNRYHLHDIPPKTDSHNKYHLDDTCYKHLYRRIVPPTWYFVMSPSPRRISSRRYLLQTTLLQDNITYVILRGRRFSATGISYMIFYTDISSTEWYQLDDIPPQSLCRGVIPPRWYLYMIHGPIMNWWYQKYPGNRYHIDDTNGRLPMAEISSAEVSVAGYSAIEVSTPEYLRHRGYHLDDTR